MFSEYGYQATTLAQIAKRAGVSVETVQKHGPKAALVWAAVEVASFGVEGAEVDFMATPQGAELSQVRDPERFATFAGEVLLGINQLAAGVWTAVTEAARADRELRGHLVQRLAWIRQQFETVLRLAAERGWLRTDLPFEDLVEAFGVIGSVEGYVRFVHYEGKSAEEYQAFIARLVRHTILAR